MQKLPVSGSSSHAPQPPEGYLALLRQSSAVETLSIECVVFFHQNGIAIFKSTSDRFDLNFASELELPKQKPNVTEVLYVAIERNKRQHGVKLFCDGDFSGLS